MRGNPLAGLPNISKVPAMEDFAILVDELSEIGAPDEGAHHYPSGRHTDGSHTSNVTSHGDPRRDVEKYEDRG
jgi:hypothetical protein